MIDGKLGEMEKEPRNVQVVISEAEHGAERLSLWDDDGWFLDVDPGSPDGDGGEKETESAVTVGELQAALDHALEENAQLRVELQQQQMALEEERSQIEALKKENERLEETTILTRVSELEGELKRKIR